MEYEYEMIQETAETIAQLAQHVTRTLSEERLYAFLTCGVESVQKSAYLLTDHFYCNFLPEGTPFALAPV